MAEGLGSVRLFGGGAAVFREAARGSLADWCCLSGALVVLLLIRSAVPPHEQYITQADWPSYMYPRHPNTVPSWSVPVISLVISPAFFAVAYLVRRNVQELHMMLLGCVSSVVYCGLITEILKRMVGRPRPDFFARCFPGADLAAIPGSGYPQCTGSVADIVEGRQSFPSGHTSWCTSGLAFITLWLMMVLSSGGLGAPSLPPTAWRFWVAMSPLSCAVLIGVTRFMDYWHHWTDVVTGFVLGLTMAWLNFRLYAGVATSPFSSRNGSSDGRRDKGRHPMLMYDDIIGMDV
mmetsp:Transcript_13897/g.35712  ORF Transcript_13897/g.35712 Transcript_13897/m.35712 type:complete len:291 (+) Transcript_13897:102-974(+)